MTKCKLGLDPDAGTELLADLLVCGISCAYPTPVKIAENNRTETIRPNEAEQKIDPMFFYYRDIAI